MIEVYAGMPGNGKTFALTYRAMRAMKKGKKVFSNYPLRGAFRITFEDLINYTFPEGSVIIIDEAGRWFSSRKWSDLPDQVFDLFTLHRHLGLDLLVAVQDISRIDKALREVVEIMWWSRNYLGFPFFVYRGYYNVERFGMKGEHDLIKYIPKFTKARKLYDTHAMKSFINKNLIPEVLWFENEQKTKKKFLFYIKKQLQTLVNTSIIKITKKRSDKNAESNSS
jgi:hypothetical protein